MRLTAAEPARCDCDDTQFVENFKGDFIHFIGHEQLGYYLFFILEGWHFDVTSWVQANTVSVFN